MHTLIDPELKQLLEDKKARKDLFEELLNPNKKEFDVHAEHKKTYKITVENYLDHKKE